MSIDTTSVRNGVNTEQMYGTLDLITEQPALAQFQFRVSNRWIEGAHNRSRIQGFYGAGEEDTSRAIAVPARTAPKATDNRSVARTDSTTPSA